MPSSAIACSRRWRDNCQLTPRLPCGSWGRSSGDGPGDKYPWLLRSYLHRPRVGFLFRCSPLWGQCFLKDFEIASPAPSFWDGVLHKPGWPRSQKLDPKVIKYWGHRLATVLGTCVTALLTWAFRSSRCHPAVFLLCVRGGLLCIRGGLLCVRGDLLSTVSGSHRRLCPDHHLSIITLRASSQSRFFLTHFFYDPEKTPIFFMALVETERNQERLHLQSFPKQSGTGCNCNISETQALLKIILCLTL